MGNIILQNNSVIWLQEQNHDTQFTSSCCICYWRKKKHLNLSENAFYEVSRGWRDL